MKKIIAMFLIIGALIGATNTAKASQQWDGGLYRTQGFTFTLQGGFPGFTSTTFGWQMGPHFNLGVKGQYVLPLSGLSMRYYLKDKKNTPLMELDVAMAPSLMVGVAFGKLEITGGLTLTMADYDWDINLGVLNYSGSLSNTSAFLPTLNISYTFSFRKW